MVIHPALDNSNCQTQKTINLAHPLCVASGEVIIDGNNMNAFFFKGIKINRQGGYQSLAFACSHFSNLTAVKNDAAHNLNIKVALSEGSLCRFPHRGESIRQNIIQRFASSQTGFKPGCARPQSFIIKFLEFRLERVYGINSWLQLLDDTIIRSSKQSFG